MTSSVKYKIIVFYWDGKSIIPSFFFPYETCYNISTKKTKGSFQAGFDNELRSNSSQKGLKCGPLFLRSTFLKLNISAIERELGEGAGLILEWILLL